MFRFEVGATILVKCYLVKRYGDTDPGPIEVEILAKAPKTIKVEVLSGNWFRVGSIQILTSDKWFSVGRMREE